MPRVPSMNALTAFDAAARHQSIARAAGELDLTESAISKQISSLEDRLGVKLFDRIKQRLYLTRAGQAYRTTVAELLERLERETLEVMAYGGDGGVLQIAALPTVGASWLVPRLRAFNEEFPSIHVNVQSRTERFLFAGSDVDGALYFGDPVWEGATTDFLFEEILVPVGAPSIVLGGRLTNTTIKSCRLLHLSTRPGAWRQWREVHGIEGLNDTSGPRFGTQAMVISAAVHGLGVALAPKFLVANEIRQGLLAVLSSNEIKSQGAYYFATPNRKASSPPLQAFLDWLRRQTIPASL